MALSELNMIDNNFGLDSYIQGKDIRLSWFHLQFLSLFKYSTSCI